jgi:thymidylate synthase ThyX
MQGISVRILADSLGPSGKRLTTWELKYPRFVHAELMTHRVFSRNAASSRAIPNKKLRERVENDPAMPVWWGKNQKGMQAREEVSDEKDIEIIDPGGDQRLISQRDRVKHKWLKARDLMLKASQELSELGLHKQICNRIIEPWMYITVILTATEFDNWFKLRAHPDAQPEIANVAFRMKSLYTEEQPRVVVSGAWHTPLLDQFERAEMIAAGYTIEDIKMVSTGRCARVSYLTHDGQRDWKKDIELHDRLLGTDRPPDEPKHLSPFEHVAMALPRSYRSGNFLGWHQYRKEVE